MYLSMYDLCMIYVPYIEYIDAMYIYVHCAMRGSVCRARRVPPTPPSPPPPQGVQDACMHTRCGLEIMRTAAAAAVDVRMQPDRQWETSTVRVSGCDLRREGPRPPFSFLFFYFFFVLLLFFWSKRHVSEPSPLLRYTGWSMNAYVYIYYGSAETRVGIEGLLHLRLRLRLRHDGMMYSMYQHRYVCMMYSMFDSHPLVSARGGGGREGTGEFASCGWAQPHYIDIRYSTLHSDPSLRVVLNDYIIMRH